MPDLMPDTSIYQHAGQSPGGLGNMSLGQLLATAQEARGLQTQSAVSDALRASGGDPNAALGSLMKPGTPGYMTPGIVSDMAQAAKAKGDLQAFYNDQIDKGTSGLYAKAISKTGANYQDWHHFATLATGYGIPAKQLVDAENRIVRPDGRLDPVALADFHNTISGGQPLPQVAGKTAEGRSVSAPAATQTYGGTSGGPQVSGGVITTETPAGTAVGLGAGADYRVDSIAARNFPSDVTPLRHIIQGLQDGTITGRSTEEVNNLRNFLHTTGIDAMFGKDLSKETVPYEEMHKYMVRAADQASGGQTNDRLAAAVSGNPNMKLLNASNLDLAKVNLGLRRMQQVGYQEFQKQQQSGAMFNGHPLQYEDYTNWYTQWAAKQDSRAFVHDLLTKDQRQGVFDSMKGDRGQLDAYRSSWEAMHNNHPEIERAGAP